jgi:hypothetical protein
MISELVHLLDLLHLLLPESLQLLLLQMLVMKLWLHLLLQQLRNLDDQNKWSIRTAQNSYYYH